MENALFRDDDTETQKLAKQELQREIVLFCERMEEDHHYLDVAYTLTRLAYERIAYADPLAAKAYFRDLRKECCGKALIMDKALEKAILGKYLKTGT